MTSQNSYYSYFHYQLINTLLLGIKWR